MRWRLGGLEEHARGCVRRAAVLQSAIRQVSSFVKPSVYIESSLISYLASRASRDVIVAARQAISHDWWSNQRNRFDLRISGLVEEEIGRGDDEAARRRMGWVAGISSLGVTEQAVELAGKLLAEEAIPAGSEEDALHIAIAAAQGADYLLTWNFRHINNAEKKSAIAEVVESFGFACPEICSPEELGGGSDD